MREIGRRLIKRGIVKDSEFIAVERNLGYVSIRVLQAGATTANWRILSCFGHIIQLSIEDFMGEITSKAAVATKQAIWDYDPEEEENLINGDVDAIAVVRTLAVKVSLDGYLSPAPSACSICLRGSTCVWQCMSDRVLMSVLTFVSVRSRHQASGSKSSVASRRSTPSLGMRATFHSITTLAGVAHTAC